MRRGAIPHRFAAVALAAAACLPHAARATGVTRLHLVWTNDVHGHVAPEGATFINPDFPPPLGGGRCIFGECPLLREIGSHPLS